MAEAYNSVMSNTTTLSVMIGMLSHYVPILRKIPIAINKKYNNAREVTERESKRLIEEKYDDDKNDKLDGKDLLSLLININKTLPIEEKMTDDEMRYQVVKKFF